MNATEHSAHAAAMAVNPAVQDTATRTQTRHVTTRSLTFHVREAGAGEPVVFLHGFPQDSWMWRRHLATLGAPGGDLHCIAPDMRGFGATDKPRERVTRQLLARDVIDLIDALGVDRVSLVGHDWGGIIASAVALQYPHRVRRLALIDTLCTTWIPWAVHGWWFKDEPRPERFFAAHGRAFVASLFAGTKPPYGGWPEVPWLPPSSRLDPSPWWSAADVQHYVDVFDDPDTWFNAISYYRDALPFHRRAGGGGAQHVSNARIGAEWSSTPSTPRAPNASWYPDFAPEDRHLTYKGPTLLIYSRYLAPGPFTGLAPGRLPADDIFSASGPGSDEFTASFHRHFPALRTRASAAGHFIPEEDPVRTEQCLREWLTWTPNEGAPT